MPISRILQDKNARPRQGSALEDEGSRATEEVARLFEQHNQTLVAFLVRRLGSEAEAREVAQEAYVRLLQLDNPGAISFLRAYLFKTAANIALDRIRHRRRGERIEPTYSSEDLAETCSPDRQLMAKESIAVLRQALREVDRRHCRAFLLHRFGEHSSEVIGKRLGISSRQARTWIQTVAAYCRLRVDGLSESEAKERLAR